MLDDRWMWIHTRPTGSTLESPEQWVQDPLPSMVFTLISREDTTNKSLEQSFLPVLCDSIPSSSHEIPFTLYDL